jgi:phosphomannomutase/phosphoglucomutase
MKPVASRLSPLQQIISLLFIACLSALVAYYSVWFWLTKSENHNRFLRQVEYNTELYSQKTQAYLMTLTKTLTTFADEVPNALFLPKKNQVLEHLTGIAPPPLLTESRANQNSMDDVIQQTPQQQQQQWLKDKRPQWKEKLPESSEFTFFTRREIDTMTSSLRFGRERIASTLVEYGVNFLFLDMVNRLNDNQLVYTEVAKVAGTDQWQLHHVTMINNDQGHWQGVLYTTLDVNGLRQSWGAIDSLLGEITVLQKVEQGTPLIFFRMGQASNNMPAITKNIPASYWQISYQPSTVLLQKNQIIPFYLWSITTAFPLCILFLGLIYIARSRHIDKATLPTKKRDAVNNSALNTQIDKKDTSLSFDGVSDKDPVAIFPDAIFRAYDIRGIVHEEFTHDLVYAIGQAYATEVLLAGDTSVVVGWDARTHSQEFSVCLIEGIHSTGCHTINIGVVPTPLMNFSVHENDATKSGIVITASHNPKEYNGCKMVINGQTLVDNDIQRIKERIQSSNVTHAQIKGQSTQIDLSQEYIDRVISDVAVIDGFKVVVDAANGASSELAPRLMNALRCHTHGLYCKFDGDFPNHDPDPSVAENLVDLISAVVSKQADIGFALDGDGDRLVVITAAGKIVWPDQLMMLFSQDIVARNPGCDVVFDIKCTQLLAQTISDNGGRPVMWKTGHSHIKAKMKETNALLGGEFSGHIFFKERWYGFDDGLYAAARLLEIMTLTGQTIDQLLEALPTRLSTPEIKIAVSEARKFIVMDTLVAQANFPGGQKTTIDGLRVDFANGWGLVRASNTAPVLTLRFEASDEAVLEQIKQQFKQALKKVDNALMLDF